jgi:hypothetical protein
MNSKDLGVKGLRGSGSDSGCFYAKQYNSKSLLVRIL